MAVPARAGSPTSPGVNDETTGEEANLEKQTRRSGILRKGVTQSGVRKCMSG